MTKRTPIMPDDPRHTLVTALIEEFSQMVDAGLSFPSVASAVTCALCSMVKDRRGDRDGMAALLENWAKTLRSEEELVGVVQREGHA